MRGTRSPRGLGIGVVAMLMAVLSGACTDSATDTSSRDPNETGSAPPKVVVVTYDAFALPEAAAAAFESETGASIEVVAAGDSGSMLAGALLSAGAPEGDVIFGIDNTTAAEAASADLLEPYQPEAASALGAELAAPQDVAGQLTPIDTSEVCVNVDDEWFAAKGVPVPTGFEDLADPRYADLLAVESPVNSSPGVAFLLGTVETYGTDGFADYWERLRDNGVQVAPSWDDAYYNDYTVSGGDRPLVVSYASSPPAEVVFSEGTRTEPASSVMTDTCVTQVEYAGVLKGAEHPELARELIDFMLTDAWQQELPLSNFVYPVTDAPLPEEFQQWAPRPPAPITIDVEAVDANRDEWIEQWRSVME